MLYFFVVCGNNLVKHEPTLIIVKGTTEKIFEEKKELYDVYIDNQNVKTHRSHLQPLLRLNAADKEKYRKLSEQRYAITQLVIYLTKKVIHSLK